jgi:rare lipoprotein A (peptidoglycan hydrolase)
MRRSSKNLRELCVLALILALFVVQGCSTLSGDRQPRTPTSFDTQAGVDKDRPAAAVQSAHVGEASWYGPGFDGKKTASGDIFDDSKLTAAHKTIPLGSKAKITNLTNGKTVEVKINDRGPFVEGRIVDLSHAAAKSLGLTERGIAKVQIDLLSEVMSPKGAQK